MKLTDDLQKVFEIIIVLQDNMVTLTHASLILVLVDSSLFQSAVSTFVTAKFNIFKT